MREERELKPGGTPAAAIHAASVRARARLWLDRVIRRYGYRVVPEAMLDPWQLAWQDQPSTATAGAVLEAGPSGADPRLARYVERYRDLPPDLRACLLWTAENTSALELKCFRGGPSSIGYLATAGRRGLGPAAYGLTYFYTKSNDPLGLLSRLQEDSAFGVRGYEIEGRLITRDLLDSIQEIGFLDRQLSLGTGSGLTILDIGAGYGRLAHRALSALPSLAGYMCTDAVPVSSFLCEYYLSYRGVGPRASVVAPNEVEDAIARQRPQIAVNIHSFSECLPGAVAWWIRLLARSHVEHLFIVPNPNDSAGARLTNGRGEDLQPVIEQNGYSLAVREAKYHEPLVQEAGLYPTHYWLFRRQS